MCFVSMIVDDWTKTAPLKWPQLIPTNLPDTSTILTVTDPALQNQIDELKKEVKALKKLLKAAKIFDEANNQPDCEMEEKIALLRKIGELVGVNLEEVFKKNE